MSSESDYKHVESSQESSSDNSRRHARPLSRRQSRTPLTPRKRRRLESVQPTRIRKYHLEGRYNDAYRELFNEQVSHAASRFQANEDIQHYSTQIGASVWTAQEQATLFAALERLGKDNTPAIAKAIGTKSVPETRELLLLLQDAASKQGDVGVTLRDVPAAIEVGRECNEQLDITAEALAWFQESFEEKEEQDRYGRHWLITPTIAEEIEHAVNGGRSRAPSATPASEPDPARRGVAGSCTFCKHRKAKCDRKAPCSTCVRYSNENCVYPPKKTPKAQKPMIRRTNSAPVVSEEQDQKDAPIQAGDASAPDILEAIPEASLLQPEAMLTLSKNLFMNRSSTIPSPWPHWSQYVSDVVTEPSIYRTAFNDFHTLVLSVTKRLMQTAIVQATSRLRAQRHRTKKGLSPYVKKRDVLAAIDILGMKRDGKERWKGVARRCGVRVFAGQYAPGHQGKSKREVPWDEVERVMDRAESVSERSDTETPWATSGGEDEPFNFRAKRSGTPLPMERLALDTSDDDLGDEEFEVHNVESDESLDDEMHQSPRLESPSGNPQNNTLTLEAFDRQASRQEERSLWNLLGLEPTVKDDTPKSDEEDDTDLDDSENIITEPDGWRSWVEYQPEWEELRTLVPAAKFTANQKPEAPMPITQANYLFTSGSESGNETGTSGRRRHKRTRTQTIELQTQGPRAYAALQERAFMNVMNANGFGSDDDNGVDMDHTVQSVEDDGGEPQAVASEDEMDWDA
ncbi:hypothetical protein P153DRAFT_368243 [Dothidotthia symphoricarpi CBS 119687]|uniref:Zn(2)-C6 fungal-type domain-containing protein n=1 Tax=Dothidotthia symphoricarpi CBS 119687 TaxID=1392245 RepID=A0A6A6A9Y1_9PLEO|nr:uncharacterized protein P153DRAFT_368243 [Dothidotthia symphoricarpi CBS 119687]KAF2127668.1 hypothetical protein P153DRAFT_368243 [Dothidotthia symphoricarpi CBS 119687]